MAGEIKNLTDQDVEAVCSIIDGWASDEKLTWEGLLAAIEMRYERKWSRQALDRHSRIKAAFRLKKRTLQSRSSKEKKDDGMAPDLKKAYEIIAKHESTIERQAQEINGLLERFMRWSYNAASKGLTEEYLDKPLYKVDRGSTRG